MLKLLPLFAATAFFISCKPNAQAPAASAADARLDSLEEVRLEAIEDSVKLATALRNQLKITDSITADAETRAVNSPNVDDDAADDMAIWVNPSDPAKSTLIGTNKKGGVVVFNLKGEDLAFYPTGRINNIDVLYGFQLGKEKIDLVGCTNRTDQSVDLYRVNPSDGTLADVAAGVLKVDTHAVRDVYGFCFFKGDKPYLFLSGKNGAVQQFELVATPSNTVDIRLVRSVRLNSQVEGLVADEDARVLYIGEEDQGIWKMSADPAGGDTRTLVPMSGADNPNIDFDVEGLTLYKKGKAGYLLASIQGNFSYAVFDRTGNNRYLGNFKIVDGPTIDGVQETDGIDVNSAPLGPDFPDGIFVAQDGFNYDGKKMVRQNFKMMGWGKIEKILKLKTGKK